MRVFVTGASGFIGSAVVAELIQGGHQILGLARSDSSARDLEAAGAEVHRGTLEDLESLRSGASQADAVIHTGFVHDFTKFKEVCAIDRDAIQAMAAVLVGSDRPFIVSAGIGVIPGRPKTEEDPPSPVSDQMPRASEQEADAARAQGVRAMTIRLPQVHDTVKQGLITMAVDVARRKGVSAYIGEGQTRMAAAPRQAVAELYRLVLEKGTPGATYHAVAEEGVPLRAIAEAIGRGLRVPVVSLSPEEAADHFGWLGMFMGHDMRASSKLTQERLGWNPTGPGLIDDLDQMDHPRS